MKIFGRLLNNKNSYVFGLLAFVIYTLSFLIGHEEEAANHMFVAVKAAMILISAVLYLISCNNASSDKIKEQYGILSLIILIYQIILWLAVGKNILYIRDYPAIANGIAWTGTTIISVIRYRKSIRSRISRIGKNKDTAVLAAASLIMAVIVIILSGGPSAVRFTWDSDTMYAFIYGLEYDSLFDVRRLQFYNHVSVIYCYILVMLKLVFGNIRLAFWVVNSLCIIAASFGITFTLRALVPNRRTFEYILAGAMFVFSPWVCGLSTYYMYDYYIWCLYPLMIYFLTRKRWIGFFAVGVMISFSRSPGLMVFGGVCAGIVILDLINRKKFLAVILNLRYWFFGSVAFVYYMFYRTIDQQEELWGSFYGNELGINIPHITHYIKMYTVTDFLWIFFALTMALVIGVYIRKNPKYDKGMHSVISAILIGDLILFVFYCVIITYRLPRYLDSHVAVLYICAAVFLLGMYKRKISNILTVVILLITFVGSYRTIDPVSKILFNTLNVGDHTTVDFEMNDSAALGDSVVFNRDYYSYQIVLDEVLSDVLSQKTEGDEILISLADESITWGVSGGRYSYGFNDNKHYFELFYDKTIPGLANGYVYDYYDSPDMIPFEARFVFPQESIEDVTLTSNAGRFFYIYMPTLNGSRESDIINDYTVEHEEDYEYNGWQMNCITFSR